MLNSFLFIVFQRQCDVAANKNTDLESNRPEFTVMFIFDRKKLRSILINKSQDVPELALEGNSAHGVE